MRSLYRLVRWLPWLTVGLLAFAVLLLLLVGTDRSIDAPGLVRVDRYQVVRPEIGGIVEEVLVERGGRVEVGDLLVRLEAGEERAQRLAAERELAEIRLRHRRLERELTSLGGEVHPRELDVKHFGRAAEDLQMEVAATRLAEERVELAAVQARLERARRLADAGLLSEQRLEEARLELELVRQSFERREIESRLARNRRWALDADLELHYAQQRLARDSLAGEVAELGERERRLAARVEDMVGREAARSVRASATGIVVGKPRQDLLGRWVSAGEELMTVIVPDSIEFVAEVSDVEVLRVRPGQPVRVEVSGLSRQRFAPFAGRVKSVAQSPLAEGERIVYPVTVHLETPWAEVGDERFLLRPGMGGVASIAYREEVPLYVALFELITGRSA